jgi:hypothetical protein
MALKAISRYEFDKLMPGRSVLERFTGKQVEWFANDVRNVIGAVDHARTGDTWSYVVMKKNVRDVFRVLELKAKLANRIEAETRLRRAMEAAEST